ncbi:MAG TPA: hypothetical protein VK888_07060 [Anaerolineales bacterium]|nr:hypothetical protein [Anaerolineales bacterium]
MNTKFLSKAINREGVGQPVLQKVLLASLVIALMLSLIPAQGALAAPASAGGTNADRAREWDLKLEKVRLNGIFYERVRVYPADFDNLSELAVAHDLLAQYGAALRGAQTIILNHTGFDERGRVLNEKQADQSLKDLAAYIQEKRSLMKRLDALEGDYRLLPLSVVRASTASQ